MAEPIDEKFWRPLADTAPLGSVEIDVGTRWLGCIDKTFWAEGEDTIIYNPGGKIEPTAYVFDVLLRERHRLKYSREKAKHVYMRVIEVLHEPKPIVSLFKVRGLRGIEWVESEAVGAGKPRGTRG